ncbi:MAG: hypothetical protein PHY47_14570 [Lachnospiraceae bacterium]|nr:hypothetical protein [Lachnospiraceae bacterium]
MYKEIVLNFEALQVIKSVEKATSRYVSTEMTEFDLAFLCGLIKEKKPRKIVEALMVGVAVYHLIDLPYKPDEVVFILAIDKAQRSEIDKNMLYAGYYNVL